MARDMIENNDGFRAPRDVWRSLLRGFALRCPSCGKGCMFHRYLKVSDRCPSCSEELHHHRADDAPPYFTIVIVGHVIVGGVLALERAVAPPIWVHALIWLPLTLASSLFLLGRIKGAIVGLQWALKMHGFGGVPDEVDAPPAPRPAGE